MENILNNNMFNVTDTVQAQALHMLGFHDSGSEAGLQNFSMDPVPIMWVQVPSGQTPMVVVPQVATCTLPRMR